MLKSDTSFFQKFGLENAFYTNELEASKKPTIFDLQQEKEENNYRTLIDIFYRFNINTLVSWHIVKLMYSNGIENFEELENVIDEELINQILDLAKKFDLPDEETDPQKLAEFRKTSVIDLLKNAVLRLEKQLSVSQEITNNAEQFPKVTDDCLDKLISVKSNITEFENELMWYAKKPIFFKCFGISRVDYTKMIEPLLEEEKDFLKKKNIRINKIEIHDLSEVSQNIYQLVFYVDNYSLELDYEFTDKFTVKFLPEFELNIDIK